MRKNRQGKKKGGFAQEFKQLTYEQSKAIEYIFVIWNEICIPDGLSQFLIEDIKDRFERAFPYEYAIYKEAMENGYRLNDRKFLPNYSRERFKK